MLKKIGYVAVFVSDMGRAVDFYQNSLGLGVTFRDDELGWTELATEGATLALRRPSDDWPEGKVQIGRITGITLLVPDIAAAYESLQEKASASRARRSGALGRRHDVPL